MNHQVKVFQASPARIKGLRIIAALGALSFVLGLFLDPERAWGGYLMGFEYFVQLALAGGLFLSVLTLSSARWATAMRRIPEAMTTGLPWAFGMGLLLLGGISTLYEWSHEAVVEADPVLQGKSAYLNGAFFFVRMAVFF
ncbi:MAG TPA: hypothetical protein ENJ09_09650, partial [Planctomycetes bacterium]|nr:hypothetical protein [Planctomycetota bacterium]